MIQFSAASMELQARLQAFMDEHIIPNEHAYAAQVAAAVFEGEGMRFNWQRVEWRSAHEICIDHEFTWHVLPLEMKHCEMI